MLRFPIQKENSKCLKTSISIFYPAKRWLLWDRGKLKQIILSGCGKSTIIALLLRFYDVDKGEIFIGNKNIKKYGIRVLRKMFGYV